MSVTITYFVHGTTTDNETNRQTGWLPGELSELGRQQAAQLELDVADRQFDAVICSDLTRAVDTAEVAFGDTYEVIRDGRLRECNYGDRNGTPDVQDKTAYIHTPYPNGESYKDVEMRMADLLRELHEKYDGMHVALVAHQAPQLALEVLLNGKTWLEAFAEDWRITKAYKPGWEYTIQ